MLKFGFRKVFGQHFENQTSTNQFNCDRAAHILCKTQIWEGWGILAPPSPPLPYRRFSKPNVEDYRRREDNLTRLLTHKGSADLLLFGVFSICVDCAQIPHHGLILCSLDLA